MVGIQGVSANGREKDCLHCYVEFGERYSFFLLDEMVLVDGRIKGPVCERGIGNICERCGDAGVREAMDGVVEVWDESSGQYLPE